jgi:hypothetical protein
MSTDHKTMFGWAEIEKAEKVVAGSTGHFVLTYHVGRYGIDDGGTLKIGVRFASDWGYPQFDDPQAPNYVTVETSGQGKIKYRFDLKGYIRPYQKCLVVDVEQWALAEGDTIRVVYGDRTGGSPGTIVQTFREHRFEFKVAVDCFGSGQFAELEEQPWLEIVPDEAAKLVLLAPTQVAMGEGFALGVKLEDQWGNPAEGFVGEVEIDSIDDFEELGSRCVFSSKDKGVRRLSGVRSKGVGVFRLRARVAGIEAESNAIECVEKWGEVRPFWGDLHGQSCETVGTNTVEDYFRFARDAALVDFAGHQGNDFQITAATWAEISRCARDFYEPGRFVCFSGYEWSATTPAGGDRNVYYLHDGEAIYRTSHWQVADKKDIATDRYPVAELFAELRARKALVVPHIGGRPANLAFHDPALEPVIEIYSAWGQFEWLLREAIERGYKVGFIAGSDDHKGRPGASYPGSSSFGVYGGLTCVLACDLSREGVWQALKARRCYATSGQRILLEVEADGHAMGEEFKIQGSPHFSVRAEGTAVIEEVRLMRGLETVYTYPEQMPRDKKRLRIKWSGALIRGRARIACWDGQLTLENARIEAVQPFAFDSAAEYVEAWDAQRVSWKSVTSGDEDGLLLDVEIAAGAQLHFETQLASFTLALADLGDAVHCVEAGGEELRVEVEYLPLGLESKHCAFTWEDPAPMAGCQPYYVRLTQVDGARAWSSPFYIHCGD